MAATMTNQFAIDKLKLEQRETQEEIEHLRADLRQLGEPTADENDIDAPEREKTLAIVHRLEHKLESLERALQMAQRGTYGLCEQCGARIDPARLEILPHATLCLKCQRDYERRHRR